MRGFYLAKLSASRFFRLSAFHLFRVSVLGLLALPFSGQAEDLNGIWKGVLTQGPGGCYPRYFLELQINFANDRISGKAYDYYDKAHFVKMSFTGRYNPQTHRLVLIKNRILLLEGQVLNVS